MTTVRRRVLRPAPAAPPVDPQRQRLIEKRQAQLAHERDGFERWMARLRRACTEITKRQKKIVRLERLLARLHST